MEFKDYYKTMGVEPDAGADEIKRAYRKLARKYHPDVSSEPDAEAKFKDIGEAYEVLKDPAKRKEYDQLRKSGWRGGEEFRPPPGWERGGFRDGGGFESWSFGDGGGFGERGFGGRDAGGFSDFFETLFGGARRPRQRPQKGGDLRARVEIDLETAFSGGKRRISLEQPERAPDGSVRSGARTLEVTIPPGMTEGRQIRLAGKGDPGPGSAPAGDLYLEIHIRPHRLFELDGRDVHLTLPIAPWEAALGTKVSVPTLAGKVEMNIPAGASSGQRMRLKGRGLPGKPPGDQYVLLKIVTPRPASDEQRKLYERMRDEFDFDPRAGLEAKR
ncbi:MAG: DnaJ C-terminal domain-containing protein [Wenzhouxiangellaceae bacterium]|nr:DnaJ C-terminal domain-containing protein [Wenzhouxiangellaceae bacterium]